MPNRTNNPKTYFVKKFGIIFSLQCLVVEVVLSILKVRFFKNSF